MLRNEEPLEMQQQQEQRQVLQLPIFEDNNLAQVILESQFISTNYKN